ncbi:hypothetical protein ACFFTQ_26030, partial [Streptomyces roseofulvus]|uniref:hypothetical protein n=1 Tax=Streptomyces roseofulvus TaxID=33902 RepID=UPI0035EE0536
MADEGNTFDAELAEQVFDGAERWGWEYVPPPAPLPHPAAACPPEWTEPFYPELARLQTEAADRRGMAGAIPVAVVGIGACALFNIFLALGVLAVAGAVLAATRPSRRVETAR